MFGKHFASMYEGSMVGAGAVVFAVMGYIIANSKPDRSVGTQVELNPKLLAFILGESEEDVAQAVETLSSPDPKSRSKEEEGRRLIKLGTFSYQVVNGAKYRVIRDEEERRRQNREAQARYRNKKKFGPTERERQFEQSVSDGDERRADTLTAPSSTPSPSAAISLETPRDAP